MPVFDIPTDRLVDLEDKDLRELIARLYEAERERQGGHRNEVRWGGSQTAADGGLDVVVEAVGSFVPTGPLARRDAGIQVKAADLGPAAIKNEMCYGGSLRPAISALARKSGSYIIASAGANCSEAMLQRRIDAMRAAVANDPNGANLELIYLDRMAISRWVSSHSSVAAWLRKRLTLPILSGWQRFGRWSSTPEGETDDLICEEGLVFRIGGDEPIRELPKAIDAIRNLVRNGAGAVRIAGLSGIGKSRIVQALFEQIGDTAALSNSHVIYTDLGHSPDPSPMGMLETLVERDAPAILVVDNCPPETHQILARKLAERSSPVRLITVEYDVRIDRPENTDVVRVEAQGPNIVAALLRRRRPYLSYGDARRLAELAQGNARLGFALAEAAPLTGTLSAFEDASLFDRLFWQREERNDELARAAGVLSLVYSFEVEGEEEPDELTFLGSLAELSRSAMHRYAAILLDRGLAQARGRWRAVLPHALANRLAAHALRSIPWRTIADGFASNQRLLQSFARRLSYLHNSDEARRIVIRWMEQGGPLYGPTLNIEVLEAVCHLVPHEALQAIDGIITARQASPDDFHSLEPLIRMIPRIAHSAAMFPHGCERLVTLSIAFAAEGKSNADYTLGSLFSLYLSGTLAQTDMRIDVARRYLFINDPNCNVCGIIMLRSALQTGQWSSSILPYDDARPDAFGWEPHGQDVEDWFIAWLNLTAETALDGPICIRDSARNTLADEIGHIWRSMPTLRPQLDEITRGLHAAAPWHNGRHSLMKMLHHIRGSGEEFTLADTESVRNLIDYMAPLDLKARVCAELVKGWSFDYDYEDDDFDAAEARRAQRLKTLGRDLAVDQDSLRAVGRDLLDATGGSFFPLGEGLAEGATDPMAVWAIIRDLHLTDPSQTRQTSVLSGFIQMLDISQPAIAADIRLECLATSALRQGYCIFLASGVLPARELEHVIEIAGEPETQVWQFSDISWREERKLRDEDRIRLLRSILGNSGGPKAVVDALRMLRHVERNTRDQWPEDLRNLGIEAITAIINAGDFNSQIDADLARAISNCLRGDDGSGASLVMAAVVAHASRRYGSISDVERMLSAIAENAPEVFLNHVFLQGEGNPQLRFQYGRRPGPLSHVPAEALIEWCRQSPDRWTKVAHQLSPFTRGIDDEDEVGQITPLAQAILYAAPRPEDIAEAYLKNLSPMSWSGSRAAIMERRLAMIENLQNHPAPLVGQTISRLAAEVRARIDRIHKAEQEEDRDRDQSFE